MFKDSFDKICWALLAVVTVALVALTAAGSGSDSRRGDNKALEREMTYHARVELINKLFGPVEQLRGEGKHQEALLRLDELNRKYPGEAHGRILQGMILREMGAGDEAVASLVEGVRINGDYVDRKSPLSRRTEIQRLVDERGRHIAARAAANPNNRSAAELLGKLNYLKSRLAGGCE